MQVKDIIELFHFQGLEKGMHVTIQDMDFIDKRISPDQGKKFLFGKKMYLCILYLFFQAAHYRCGKNDITDGTETYDQVFYQI